MFPLGKKEYAAGQVQRTGDAAGATAAVRRRMGLRLRDATRQKLWAYAFILPVLILFLVFRLYPMLRAITLSFQNYNFLTPPTWVGLANYENIFTNSVTLNALRVSGVFVVVQVIPLVFVALVLALIIFTIPRFRHFFELTFYFPVVMTTVVAALIWLTLFYTNGLLDDIVSPFFPHGLPWLTNPNFAMASVVTVGIWQVTGYYMILLLAGLLGIPGEYLEAAAVDGARDWSRLWHIILPLLRPQLGFVCILAVINAAQAFDSFFVLTQGGPNGATNILPLQIYTTAFQLLQMGPAAALSMVLFVFLMIVTVIQLKFFRFQESL